MTRNKALMLIFVTLTLEGVAQSRIAGFSALSRPMKCWVIFHPFVAGRAERVSQHVLDTLAVFAKQYHLTDPAGGSLDAFRHTYWMALLTKEIGWHRAYRLGLKYEKGNKRDLKKGHYEEGAPPDEPSMLMDMWNNSVGISMCRYASCPDDSLPAMVINAIRHGDCKVIRKNDDGVSLNSEGQIIDDDEWQGLWKNDRSLVKSH